MIHDTTALVKTLDNINEMQLLGKVIPQDEGLEAARWIVTRLGQKGSYRGMFAPTRADFEQGIRVFTGERLESASARHICGQEAARAAWILGATDTGVREAYDKATGWMQDTAEFQQYGTFCCGKCTLAYWRHYWIGNFANKDANLEKGLQVLNQHRTEDGKWRRFPFFYGVYTLLGLDLDPARAELRHARPVLERYLRTARQGEYPIRKAVICKQALELVD